jgi:uncharacterized membrane-anchored protein YjiN (DUF445 family)
MYSLTSNFVEIFCKLPDDHPHHSNMQVVIHRALTVMTPSNVEDELLEVLRPYGGDASLVDKLLKIFKTHLTKEIQVRQVRTSISGETEENDTPTTTATVSTDIVEETDEIPDRMVESGNGRKRPIDEDDLPDRNRLKKMKTTHEKIFCIQNIMEKMPKDDYDLPQQSKLTSGARFFFHNTLQPVTHCLRHHCGNSVDRFIEKWPEFQHSKFKDTCCSIKSPCVGAEERCG